MATIIDGRAVASRVREEAAAQAAELADRLDRLPGLATVLIGNDEASATYVKSKHKACGEAGMESFNRELPADVTREDALALIDELNDDPAIDGILCQLPLPDHLDPDEVTNRIDPDKDVDGLTTVNAGRLALGMPGLRPCTPAGVMVLLEEAGIDLRGADAVVIGRSNLFGKPMAQMLLAADATVTLCHSRSRSLRAQARRADVLVAAVGRPRFVGRGWVKPGATVIDVGISRTDAGLVGDVEFDGVVDVAGAITPVPGGVGPMTIAMLLRNTLQAAGSG